MSIKKELIVHIYPKSPVSESFRTLRTNIQFMNTNRKIKTLLVTSTFPGEGKSWVSSNLAATFAQAGNKVVLIDADMRKGRQYTIFGILPTPGLSNCITKIDMEDNQEIDFDKYIQKTEIENLYVMTAGNVPPNPSELLVSPQMERMLNQLKDEYDLVIIDGTPCELVTDSVILSRMTDSTVIVTAHKETRKDNLEKVIKSIKNVGGNLAGIVLNKMPGLKSKQYYNSESAKEQSMNNKKKIEENETLKTPEILTKKSNNE